MERTDHQTAHAINVYGGGRQFRIREKRRPGPIQCLLIISHECRKIDFKNQIIKLDKTIQGKRNE